MTVRYLDETVAALEAPVSVAPVAAPDRRVVVDVDVLLVLTANHLLLGALEPV